MPDPIWRIMCRLDRRWHARGTLRRDWQDRRPRLWAFTTVPLSTWLTRPSAGRESYQEQLEALLLKREMRQLAESGER